MPFYVNCEDDMLRNQTLAFTQVQRYQSSTFAKYEAEAALYRACTLVVSDSMDTAINS